MEEAPPVRARSGLTVAVALITLVGGCDRLFGIEEQFPDAAPRPDVFDPDADRDRDGIPDAIDNCPDVVNADQSDVDQDGFGDVCDRCPLDAGDQLDTDGDGIGNACDPSSTPFDCLILLDTFGDPVTFADHWLVTVDTGDMPRVTFGPTKPTIAPTAGKLQAMYAIDHTVMLPGPHDVEVLGIANLGPDSAVLATTFAGVTSPRIGGMCGFRRGPTGGGTVSGVNDSYNTTGFTTAPFFDYGTDVVGPVRMTLDTDMLPAASCTVGTNGVPSNGEVASWGHPPPSVGGSGVTVFNTAFEVDAVALYRQRAPADSCPPTIWR